MHRLTKAVATFLCWLISSRVSRFLPWRYVLFADVRHGCKSYHSSAHLKIQMLMKSTEHRAFLLPLRKIMGQPSFLQFFTLQVAWILHDTSRHLACPSMSPALLRYPECISASGQLWKIYVDYPVLHESQPLPSGQNLEPTVVLHLLRYD